MSVCQDCGQRNENKQSIADPQGESAVAKEVRRMSRAESSVGILLAGMVTTGQLLREPEAM